MSITNELIILPEGLPQRGAEGITLLASGACTACAETHGESGCPQQCGQCSQCWSQGCTSGQCGSTQSCGQCGSSQSSGERPDESGTISVISSTSTSITLRIFSITLATSYVIVYRPSTEIETIKLPATTSLNYTISGLQPNTEYVINYYGQNDYGTGPYMPDGVIAKTKSNRTNYFSWTSGLVSSKPSTNSLSSGEAFPAYFNASGWNAFTNNINEVRESKGLSSHSFTQAISGRTALSASMVNQAITAIKAMSPPISPPSATTSGGTVISASLLNKLMDSINSVI